MKMSAKEICLEVSKEEKRNVERVIYQSKKEVYEQFERKMNKVVNGNRELFWKEISQTNGGNVENYSIIKDRNWRLALEEIEV